MTYNLVSHDGNVAIAALALDTTTALTLPGKDYSGWGQYYSQDFLSLLENFAFAEPSKKRTGMLWYDVSVNKLKVWSGSSWTTLDAAADKLTTARTIALTGAVTGSVSFDGSSNVTMTATLVPSGVTANSYLSANITVDQYGRITSATSGLTGNDIHTPVTSFNTRIGDVTLTIGDVTAALGYTPLTHTGGATPVTSADVIAALGFTPASTGSIPSTGGFVNKSGDTMSGQLNMNGNRIQNLPAPVGGAEPARLADVQAVYGARTQRVYNGAAEQGYNVTVSSGAPSGGNDGDVWYRY
jgi:hypothetical protein